MSKMSIYESVDPEAVWVAGRRVPEDRRLALTEDEARYELLAGTIRPVEPQPVPEAPPARKPGGKGAEA